MSNYAISLKRTGILFAALAFTATMFATNFLAVFLQRADALQLSNRSLTMSSTLSGTSTTGVDGSETKGSAATHTAAFTPTANTIGSALFKYCTAAVGTCTAPTGLNMANTTLGTTTGFAGTYSIYKTSLGTIDAECTGTNGLNNCVAIRAASATAEAATAKTVPIQLVVNPTNAGTFFVRMVTYDTNTNSSPRDDGTVTGSVTEGIVITSRVAETLGFSTSGALATANTAGDVAPGANCAPLTGSGAITIGDPTQNTLSLSTTYDNYSGFRIFTNAANGTLIQYEGDTLRRGGAVDIDPAGGTLVASTVGAEQFGIGMDLVNGGTSVAIASSATNRQLTNYETGNTTTGVIDGGAGGGGITAGANYLDGAGTIVNGGTASFAFVGDADTSTTAQTIATGSGFITCVTGAIRYIANVGATTPAGTYSTTIIYSAVPTY